MDRQTSVRSRLFTAAALGALLLGTAATAQAPLSINTARVTIAGTSNVHDYTASTSVVKITRAQFAENIAGPGFWTAVQAPGGLIAFEISIPAETLKSSKEGLDKNMYKALKTKEHSDITFRLARIEGTPGALKAVGMLRVAGVDREVTLPLTTKATGAGLSVAGALDVLMPDYGIKPPTAMLGMVRADPKITVTFDVLLGVVATE